MYDDAEACSAMVNAVLALGCGNGPKKDAVNNSLTRIHPSTVAHSNDNRRSHTRLAETSHSGHNARPWGVSPRRAAQQCMSHPRSLPAGSAATEFASGIVLVLTDHNPTAVSPASTTIGPRARSSVDLAQSPVNLALCGAQAECTCASAAETKAAGQVPQG